MSDTGWAVRYLRRMLVGKTNVGFRADKVAVMKHGRIVEHGTYEELVARGVDFRAEVEASPAADAAPKHVDDDDRADADSTQANPAAANGATSNGQAQLHMPDDQVIQIAHKPAAKAASPAAILQKGDLVKVSHGCW